MDPTTCLTTRENNDNTSNHTETLTQKQKIQNIFENDQFTD